MKKTLNMLLIAALAVLLNACYHPLPELSQKENKAVPQENKPAPELKATKSIVVPKDREVTPIAGETIVAQPDTVITISAIGQKFDVRPGQEINFIYEDTINPDETFFVYESTVDGYTLELRKRQDEINISFNRICQLFIVASPNLTNVAVPPNLKFEQVIWTPRADGSWEVRIGSTERGCRSKAMQDLKNLRSKEYENSIPK